MLQLQIETTSTCNARCVFCVYPSAARWGKLMPMSLFTKIIEDASSIHQIFEVCLTGLGEPTLDPLLIQRIQHVRRVLPKVVVGFYTNGVYLTRQLFEAARDAGLGYVVVSLNAVNQQQHQSQMGLVDKFYEVCTNADYAIKHRLTTKVEVRAVVARDVWSKEDSARFFARWGAVQAGGYGQLIHEGNWANDGRTLRPLDPNSACGRALGQIYVMADGRVTTCCFDPTGRQIFGDLNTHTIREVYNSEPYVAFREAHADEKAASYEICAKCSRI